MLSPHDKKTIETHFQFLAGDPGTSHTNPNWWFLSRLQKLDNETRGAFCSKTNSKNSPIQDVSAVSETMWGTWGRGMAAWCTATRKIAKTLADPLRLLTTGPSLTSLGGVASSSSSRYMANYAKYQSEVYHRQIYHHYTDCGKITPTPCHTDNLLCRGVRLIWLRSCVGSCEWPEIFIARCPNFIGFLNQIQILNCLNYSKIDLIADLS